MQLLSGDRRWVLEIDGSETVVELTDLLMSAGFDLWKQEFVQLSYDGKDLADPSSADGLHPTMNQLKIPHYAILRCTFYMRPDGLPGGVGDGDKVCVANSQSNLMTFYYW